MGSKCVNMKKRGSLNYEEPLGQRYLELRRERFLGGKTRAIAAYHVIQTMQKRVMTSNLPISVLDVGCSDGSILDYIKMTMNQECPKALIDYTGLDFNKKVIDIAKKTHKGIKFIHADITKTNVRNKSYDIIILINTLHEIFSLKAKNKHYDFKKGKREVRSAFSNIAGLMSKGGTVFLYDGVECPKTENKHVRVKIKDDSTEKQFKKFAKEYQPVLINYKLISKHTYEMSIKAFTRFITKLRFLDSPTWELEKEESYQYFDEREFEQMLEMNGLVLSSKILMSPHLGEWQNRVEILSSDISFPTENMLIVAEKI